MNKLIEWLLARVIGKRIIVIANATIRGSLEIPPGQRAIVINNSVLS